MKEGERGGDEYRGRRRVLQNRDFGKIPTHSAVGSQSDGRRKTDGCDLKLVRGVPEGSILAFIEISFSSRWYRAVPPLTAFSIPSPR